MGKGKRSNRPKKFNVWQKEIVKSNELFEKYYKAQKIIPEAEWDNFMSTARRELPHSFRISGFRSNSEIVRNILEERYLTKLSGIVIDDQEFEAPVSIPWYPGGMAFQLRLPRKTIRKHPLLDSFHNFLITETEVGNISRQETVSMIPPLLLNLTSTSKVLDMCAAPGSKTAQLIEMLHSDPNVPIPTGFVLANDSDCKRCYLLVHQTLNRLQSPCCIITNHDASQMPSSRINDASGQSVHLQFDRILCDVPCSGDGTIRKNTDVWARWNSNSAYNIHRLQLKIAKRGVELLAPDGIMVYSTCSMNPAENEAVIAELLEFGKGTIELVDVSDQLPGLKRSPGLYSWTVMDKQGNFYSSYEDLPANMKLHIPRSTFPPPTEQANCWNLHRCCRVYPHQQDTGGFFFALIRKKAQLPWYQAPKSTQRSDGAAAAADGDSKETKNGVADQSQRNSDPISADDQLEELNLESGEKNETNAPPKKKIRYMAYKEEPFCFLLPDDPLWPGLQEFYGISPDFPNDQLLGRSREDVKRRHLYFVNSIVKNVLQSNSDRLRIINAGVKVFSRFEGADDTNEKYRLSSDGLNFVLPFLNQRVIACSSDDLASILMANKCQSICYLDERIQGALSQARKGNVVLQCDYQGQKFAIIVWLGKVSVTPCVNKENKIHMLRVLGKDTTELEKSMSSIRKQQKTEELEQPNESEQGVDSVPDPDSVEEDEEEANAEILKE